MFGVLPPPPGAMVVGAAGRDCPSPAFATIGEAVAAAATDATIYVCAGTYSESVVITKNLTLLGAEYGVSAASGRTDPSAETIVTSADGPISYGAGALAGTVDGFTLEGGTDGSPGISASRNLSDGFTWIDDVIQDNTIGIDFNSLGTVPTLIEGNRFIDNDAPGGGTGTGVFTTTGPGDNVTIADNTFAGDDADADINTTGSANPAAPANGLTVTANTSTSTGDFVALFNQANAQITGNTVSSASSSAFYISGGNHNVTVADNTITAGAAPGIDLNNASYTRSTAVTVRANTISGRSVGIAATDVPADGSDTGFVITENTITGSSTDGLSVGAGDVGFAISDNNVSTSTIDDCVDQSTGRGTAGTANTWTANLGVTSQPAGLCAPAVPPPVFQVLPGAANGIAVSARGSAWVVGTNVVHGGYGIYQWTDDRWAEGPGGAVAMAVQSDGAPWVVNSSRQIFEWTGSTWTRYPGAATGIAVGANGSVWMVGTNVVHGGYGIYQWTGRGVG